MNLIVSVKVQMKHSTEIWAKLTIKSTFTSPHKKYYIIIDLSSFLQQATFAALQEGLHRAVVVNGVCASTFCLVQPVTNFVQ